MRQPGRVRRIAFAHVFGRQAHRERAGVGEVVTAVHHLMHMERVILNVGGDAPHAAVRKRTPHIRGELRLHDAALVVLHLGPRVGEERPHFAHHARRHRLHELRRVDLRDAQIAQAALAGEQQGVRHARIVAPHALHIRRVEREVGARVERPLPRIDPAEQIVVRIGIPRTLQPVVEARRAADEREHLAPIEWRARGFACG